MTFHFSTHISRQLGLSSCSLMHTGCSLTSILWDHSNTTKVLPRAVESPDSKLLGQSARSKFIVKSKCLLGMYWIIAESSFQVVWCFYCQGEQSTKLSDFIVYAKVRLMTHTLPAIHCYFCSLYLGVRCELGGRYNILSNICGHTGLRISQ